MSKFQTSAVLAALALTATFTIQAEPLAQEWRASSEEQANLVIYRGSQGQYLRSSYFTVYVDGAAVGKLKHKKRYALNLPAGSHTISASDSLGSSLEVDIQEGDIALVEGLVASKPSLHLSLRQLD